MTLAYAIPYSRASFLDSLGMVIGVVAKNVETSSVVGQVITFPMMFLSGTFFLISYMPTYIQNIAHALPLFYVIEGLNRSEEHTSELQSLRHLVCRLLLE